MPLRGYALLHPEARLDEARVRRAIEWARSLEAASAGGRGPRPGGRRVDDDGDDARHR